jgi:hypothetical protein
VSAAIQDPDIEGREKRGGRMYSSIDIVERNVNSTEDGRQIFQNFRRRSFAKRKSRASIASVNKI